MFQGVIINPVSHPLQMAEGLVYAVNFSKFFCKTQPNPIYEQRKSIFEAPKPQTYLPLNKHNDKNLNTKPTPMKAKLLASLAGSEQEQFKTSTLYTNVVAAHYNFLDSAIHYKKEYYTEVYLDTSIIVYNNAEPVLIMYSFSKDNTLSFFNEPTTIFSIDFENSDDETEAHNQLIKKIKEFAYEKNFTFIHFNENHFLTSNFFDKIIDEDEQFELFLNLAVSERILKSNIRKSYKSLINWGKRNFETVVMNSENADHSIFIKFRDFHRRVAGKITRSDTSWDMQYEAIVKNEAYLIMAYYNTVLSSATLITHGNKIAHYSVGVYDRELMADNFALAHNNLMHALCFAKKVGLKEFCLGSISKKSTDEKEKKIFYFKSGFTKTMRIKHSFTATF